MSTPALRRYIESQGGTVQDTHDGLAVTFPEEPEAEALHADAREIEAAVERAREFGTTVVRLWRERGAGWYAASSHEEHPGFAYVCQIDERTGRPLGCECVASHVCHHLGAALGDWRAAVGYEANGAAAAAAWTETLERVRMNRPEQPEEEEW